MQRYSTSMAQIHEQMMFEEYLDDVLQLDDEQFIEYYDSLNQEQQEELNEIIGKIAKGIGKIAVAPITLPYKVGKAAVKGVARAVTSKPAKAAGSMAAKGAAAAGKAAVGGVKKLAKRLSTTGRADAAAKKADAIAKRTAERERLAREKERLAKERERAKKSGRADQRAAVADRQKELDKEAEKTRDAQRKEIEKEALDDKDVDTIKPIIKQLKKSVKAHDKQAKQLTKDIQDDVNEATVTIKSYDTKTGLDRQAEKQMNAVATRAGAKVKKSGNNVYKISGNGKQLSKFMANIDQIDGSFMTEESEFMNEFTSSQIKRLKKEYEPLRGVHHTELQPARFTQLSKMMQRMGKPQLQALVKADIPVLSSAAKASLVVNHGMKFSSIKEELIPYLEVFPLDEKKSKFTSIEPKVIDRIEKMMRGSRAEKDSIANMLNFMMPPEVVDMVRYKLKIVPKRGKIKF